MSKKEGGKFSEEILEFLVDAASGEKGVQLRKIVNDLLRVAQLKLAPIWNLARRSPQVICTGLQEEIWGS